LLAILSGSIGGRGEAETPPQTDQDGLAIGVNDPGPKGVVIAVQVPLGTSFQALP
jgi:hypothetical protein